MRSCCTVHERIMTTHAALSSSCHGWDDILERWKPTRGEPPGWRASRDGRSRVAPQFTLRLGRLCWPDSAVLVLWNESYFDSNQGVIGLMAKHLSEGRAFPLFMYGQTYMLAVEAWLAAPIFLIAGPSVAGLKLPLLAINLAIALLLVRVFERDVGLGPPAAALATVFVLVPSPGTTAQLLEASGGIFEPALYVILMWITRTRPVWCGLILGLGFIHRPFTVLRG